PGRRPGARERDAEPPGDGARDRQRAREGKRLRVPPAAVRGGGARARGRGGFPGGDRRAAGEGRVSIPGLRPSPEPGDPAPDAELLDAWGQPARLSAAWDGGPAVLVFLRYFGCPFCQAQVVGLRRDHERFEETGASVALVGQGPP